jgi:hypothetical protein
LQRALAKTNNNIHVRIALAGGYKEAGRQERCVAVEEETQKPVKQRGRVVAASAEDDGDGSKVPADEWIDGSKVPAGEVPMPTETELPRLTM